MVEKLPGPEKEGHQDVEGNLQADTLAKKGIATERFVWQDIALNLYENMNADNASFTLDENSAEDFQTEIIPENASFTCKKCQMDCVDGENCIQCQDCETWIYYNCSMKALRGNLHANFVQIWMKNKWTKIWTKL